MNSLCPKLRYSLVNNTPSTFKHLVLLVFTVLLCSCSSLRTITVETSIAPEYPIADDVQSLVLLNRSMNNQFTNLSVDSLEHLLISKNLTIDTIYRDSLAADTLMHVTAHSLFESGRFDVIVPQEYAIYRNDFKDVDKPLAPSVVNEICEAYKVDALLVLEGFAEHLTTKYSYSSFEVSLSDNYSATSDLSHKSDWRLYRKNQTKAPLRFSVNDSIYWKFSGATLNGLYLTMPKTKEVLIAGGIDAGLKMANLISPNWSNSSRSYYLTGQNEIDQAETYAKQNKWDEAAAIWSKYSNNSSKKIRAKIEYNMALAAEMKGDLDKALEWALKSYKSVYSSKVDEYYKLLTNLKRKRNSESKEHF